MKYIILFFATLVISFSNFLYAIEVEEEIFCDIDSVHLIEIDEKSVNSKMRDITSDYTKKIKIEIWIVSGIGEIYDYGFFNIVGVNEPINIKVGRASEDQFRFAISKTFSKDVYENYEKFHRSKYGVLSATTISGSTFNVHKEDSSFSIIKIKEFHGNTYKNSMELFYGKCNLENF